MKEIVIVDQTISRLQSKYAGYMHNANALVECIANIKKLKSLSKFDDSQKLYFDTIMQMELELSQVRIELNKIRNEFKKHGIQYE